MTYTNTQHAHGHSACACEACTVHAHVFTRPGLSSHNSRYLYAMCCVQLGKLHDAREALTKGGDREVPNGAAGLYLLGRVNRLVGRAQDAREHYVRALRLNPLMWCAYEELCALGERISWFPSCVRLFMLDVQLVAH